MGIVTKTNTITSSVPAGKLFEALACDPANYIPQAAPQHVKSIEIIEGSGGPGSIRQTNYADGAAIKYGKYKIDVLDKNNLIYADTLIEGGGLPDKIESVTREIKFESSPDGGCTQKTTVKYHVKDGAELNEEVVKRVNEAAHAVLKAVETYLLANKNA